MFGTDGIRGTVGQEPFSYNQLHQLGHAIARWAQHTYGQTPNILLGYDTRISCSFAKSALQSGLLMHPVTIHDAQIIPTPALCQLLQYSNQFDCGIIISASHNPYGDNGLKIIDRQKGKISHEDELAITELYNQHNDPKNYTTLGSVSYWPEGEQRYSEKLLSLFPPRFLEGKKIILDCAHGATYRSAPQIFRSFGAQTIVLNATPNGTNINQNCGALYPAIIQKAVIEYSADAGFAFDGDGDRVIAINNYGAIKDGDDILALLLTHPSYSNEATVVGTSMTNQGFEIYINNNNKKLLRTAVGDKYIAEQLVHNKLLLGGEPSGHIIARDYLETGDGIFTALRIMETLILTNNHAMHTFKKFPQILINVPVTIRKDLTLHPFASIINEYKSKLQDGRLDVRYSGTELLLRVMVETPDFTYAQVIGNQLAQDLKAYI